MVPTVRSVMTSSLVVVGPETPVTEVAALFAQHRFSAIPVVDVAGRVVGLVSKLSFLRLVDRGGAAAAGEPRRARDIMDPRLATVAPNDSLTRAVDRMIRSRLRSLPVVSGSERRLIGIVSRGDVLRGLAARAEGPTAA